MNNKALNNKANSEEKVSTLKEMNFRPSSSKHTKRSVSPKSVLTVVKHKNGTRVAIDSEVIKRIGTPENVQIAFNEIGIGISKRFGDDYCHFPLMKAANKAVIYSSSLVNELIQAFNLNFSNVSSISFQDVEYLKIGSHIAATIELVPNQPVQANYPTSRTSDSPGSDPDADSTDDEELDFDSEPDADSTDDEELNFDSEPDADNTDDEELDFDSEPNAESEDDEEFDFDNGPDADSADDEGLKPLLSNQRKRKRSA